MKLIQVGIVGEALKNPSLSSQMSASKETTSRNSYFSSEKLSLFQQRYKEGYDLPDEEYMDWLCQYHHDDVLNHTSTFIGSDDCNNTLQAGSSSDVNVSSQMDSGNDHVSPICSDRDHTSATVALSAIPIRPAFIMPA